MAEKIVSPGVFTRENDLSFIQAGVEAIGGAIVGPTARGPVGIPTKVNSYAQYLELFGEAYESGSTTYQFFTSIAAKEYLKHNAPLTIVRVGGDDFAKASSSFGAQLDGVPTIEGAVSSPAKYASGSITLVDAHQDDGAKITITENSVAYDFIGVDAPKPEDDTSAHNYYFLSGSGNDLATDWITPLAAKITAILGTATINGAANLDYTSSVAGVAGNAFTLVSGSVSDTLEGGVDAVSAHNAAFKINTVGEGANLNSDSTEGTNNVLPGGTKNNFRWEITSVNSAKGTFNLLIRRGDDTSKRKTVLEQFTGLTMDPNDANYIGKRIGTTELAVKGGASEGYYLQPTGTFPNKSKYIYIQEDTIKNIPNYVDENGTITTVAKAITGSKFPKASSGSFAGGADDYNHPMKFYSDITATNVQGLNPGVAGDGLNGYTKAFGLLSNPDEFDVNVIAAPGLVRESHTTLLDTNLTEACENRGDCIAIVDPVLYDKNISDATGQADALDSSYAAMYWPWVQIANSVLGNYIWVPQSTLIPAIYAQSDKLAHEWFAPAGLNRGGIEAAIQAERKLTHANRDTLYEANVNPVATFPGEGVVVFGQKTLQKKASALDRVNVRRLLINLKKFVAGVSKFLVFENNTAATRQRFLAQVEPYMQTVQEQQGLYAFKVQMDDTNNTPDVIDRNQMKGAIFLQPAKAAEFIIIDFNIMPTGATFDD